MSLKEYIFLLCFFHLGFGLLKFCVAEMGGCACMMRLLLITSI